MRASSPGVDNLYWSGLSRRWYVRVRMRAVTRLVPPGERELTGTCSAS
jgi:hypothetical protein